MRSPGIMISLLLVFSLLLTSVVCPVTTQGKPVGRLSLNERDNETSSKEPTGLHFHLTAGPDQPEALPASNLVPAAELSQSDTESILKRLPPMRMEPTDEHSFALSERSLPPPRTGQTLNVSFPSSTSSSPETVARGPLEVLRYAPEGDVALAPHLSITFSQPMIAIDSQEEGTTNVPVKLTPQPPGKWRWVGTKTLLFEPTVRFPMATHYSVNIPAGTGSINGGTLEASMTWTFTTPPPIVKTTYPGKDNPQPRDALMFVEFDQRIDPTAVLQRIKVRSAGRLFKTRLATAEEIKSDPIVSKLVASAVQNRWLSFRALNANSGEPDLALPGNSEVEISIGPEVPSLEGPLSNPKTQAFTFHTPGPLRVTKHECGFENHCTSTDSLEINFSNQLEVASFADSKLKIEPKIKDFSTSIYRDSLSINGEPLPRTTYRITLDRSIKDRFGQTLGADITLQFKVGPGNQELLGSGGDMVVTDPFGPPRYAIYSTNLTDMKVRLYSVTADDWPKWIEYRRGNENEQASKQSTPPGRLVVDRIFHVRAKPDEMVETSIDLSAALKNGPGHAIVIVEPAGKLAPRAPYDEISTIQSWVQRTDIGLNAFVDKTDLIAWTTSLKSGAPLKDVELTLVPYSIAGKSNTDGMTRLDLKPQLPGAPVNLLVARQGADTAILSEDTRYFSAKGSWHRTNEKDSLHWCVFDDRGIYRPGEEVHVKGWIRRVGEGKGGDVGLLNGGATSVNYVIKDRPTNEVMKGTVALNPLGGFDFRFTLPANMNLGQSEITLKAAGGEQVFTDEFTHRFQVAEFRRPEFEVSTKLKTEGPLVVGDDANVNVLASYYAGGGLPNAAVSWVVTSRPASFTPPNREDFIFGKWMPWWIDDDEPTSSNSQLLTGTTDASGTHRLRVHFDSVNPRQPSTVVAEAKVIDVNRQVWASTTTMLVHPASLYVGLKSNKTFVQQGEPLIVQTIVTDLDGTAVSNRQIKIRAVLLDWKQEKGEWNEVETNPQECAVQSGSDVVQCNFAAPAGGEYRITAAVRDERERVNESEFRLWVAGGKLPNRGVDSDSLGLIPDRQEYRGGDVAQILVQAPFYPAEAVLTLQRSGIVKTERFHIDESTYTLRVPIEETWTPNVHVRVDLVGTAERETGDPSTSSNIPKRPAFASGELNLSIPPLSRKLTVVATPANKSLEPGGETTVNVEAKNADGGAATDCEVAVVVVDESVLALTEYKLADPIAAFYHERDGETQEYNLREHLVLATFPGEGSGIGPGRGGGEGPGDGSYALLSDRSKMMEMAIPPVRRGVTTIVGAMNASATPTPVVGQPPIRLRENFDALAVFAPSVHTDTNGRAQVQVKLPDNLTRYRVMAVAVAGGKQFGSGESAITARMPLMVKPSAPRFLNLGDRLELPIVMQNQTDDPMSVDLAVRASKATFSISATSDQALTTGRRLTVPANDRLEVRIPVAPTTTGTARFQVAAVSGRWSDAAEVSLPVWTPATTEAFATYGEIEKGAITQPVKAPAEVFKQFGGLELETSSTQMQQLTDAFLYLQNYPFECSEQLASRILSVAALRDVLSAFKSKEMPPPEEIEAAVSRDIKRLQALQNEDGGFGFWQRGNESWPYLSIHVAHALARARQKNFEVPSEMIEKSERYLRTIEFHIPPRYGLDATRALISYALYVRAQMGDRNPARARKFIAGLRLENLSLEALGWLLSVLSGDPASEIQIEAIRRLLNNSASKTSATAHFVSSYQDDDYLLLNSNRRADGVILEALIADQPTNDLIPKIVRGLLDQRTQGRWANTQENVFILLALDKYFNAYEKVTPDFVARIWLGNAYAGAQQFKGRYVDRQQVTVPMNYLALEKNAAQNLVVSKEGPGRLYYRLAMNYAPLNLNLHSADYGFTVERSYEALDRSDDVTRDSEGTWHIKAGARVRVRVTMATPARRYHVALVDHLPAGFESLNPELAVTESVPEDKKQNGVVSYGSRSYGFGWWLWRPVWFDYQNLRDERSEAFTTLLWGGVYNYSYVARATTPGLFVVPPTKAEEMYHPETFGRSATDRVRIE
jgi:alpha-2-macroglobulin